MSTEEKTFYGDPLPPPCCPNCDSRRVEAVALRTRARLLEESITAGEPVEVVSFHALMLLRMLKARGIV